MKTIYKRIDSKSKIIQLYDEQLAKLSVPFKDLYVDTSFGKTHLIETGNLVIPQAKAMIPNCTTYIMKNRGHMHRLTEEEKQKIVDFLK